MGLIRAKNWVSRQSGAFTLARADKDKEQAASEALKSDKKPERDEDAEENEDEADNIAGFQNTLKDHMIKQTKLQKDKLEKMKSKKVQDPAAVRSATKLTDKKNKDGASATSRKESDLIISTRAKKAYASESESKEHEAVDES